MSLVMDIFIILPFLVMEMGSQLLQVLSCEVDDRVLGISRRVICIENF